MNYAFETWLLLNSGPAPAAVNMAVDEATLESASELGRPLLRFYSWTERAATFGYSQEFTEVERMTQLRPLIRRPTGGGVVPHDADWTYSLVFPPSHSWHSLSATACYQRLHEWLQAAFLRLEITTALALCRRRDAPGQCFAGGEHCEQFDLLWEGRKIAGAAQRRTRAGLLVQGSVQPPRRLARGEWQIALREVASRDFGVSWLPFEISPALRARVEELAGRKYSLAGHNQRR